jgi:hypothetical protein
MIKIDIKRSIIILLIFFYINIYNFANQIDIHIFDENGNNSNHFSLNHPFFIELDIINKNINNPENITIPGIEQFKVIDKNISEEHIIDMFNKKRIIKILFKVLAQQEGTFNIGPVKIDQLESKAKNINIKKVDIKNDECSFKLIVANQKWYIGQKIPFTIRFQTNNKNIEPLQIEEPEVENIKVLNFSKPIIYEKEIDNQKFNIVDYKGYFLIQKEGKFKIDSLKCIYNKISEKKSKMYRFYTGFKNIIKKEIYSDPVYIDVQKLPKNNLNYNVQAIGSFKNFDIQVDKNITNIKTPIILKASIETDNINESNLDIIDPIKLNLENNLKYYISKNNIENLNNNITKRTFEYIIQAAKPGDYKIEKQKFIYFDPYKNEYKIIESKNSIDLKIEGEIQENSNNKDNLKEDRKIENDINSSEQSLELNQIISNLENRIKNYRDIKLGLKFTIINIIIAIILAIFMAILRYINNIRSLINKLKKPFIWQITKIKIKIYKILNKKDRIYKAFKEAFSNILNIDISLLNDSQIVEYLKNNNIDIDNWKVFNNRALMYAGFHKIDFNENRYNIFKEALNWIRKLKKIKNRNRILSVIIILCFNISHIYSNMIDKDKIKIKDDSNEYINTIIKLEKLKKRAYGKEFIEINNILSDIKDRYNLNNNKNIIDKIYNKYYSLIIYIHEYIWQIIFILSLYMLIIIFYLKFNILYKLAFIFLSIFSLLNYSLIYRNRNNILGLSIKKNSPIYIGPNKSYPIKYNLELGEKVKVKDIDNNWAKVKNSNKKGWIEKDNIKIY